MDTLLMQAARLEAQNHFARRMGQTAVSDWTAQERNQAAQLGWKLPTFRPYCPSERVTMSWKCL